MDRPKITDQDINDAVYRLQKEIARRLNEKGTGSFASRHEIFGVLDEEHDEIRKAVHSESNDRLVDELMDKAAGAVIGAACIMAGKTDW